MAVKDISDVQVARAYDEFKKGWDVKPLRYPEDFLNEWTGQPYKVCLRAMERAERRGLIEYGVSLHCGWLTEKGQKILSEL
ncbi:MAG: hypothetical protein EBR82_56180 [Caulobacteraceae bacterium]|nr:hypothetical protein [Caulobacteraceae bacterium]